VNAIVLAADGQDKPPAEVQLSGLQPREGATVRMLGVEEPLCWERKDDKAVIALPAGAKPCDHAWTITFPG
jgi:hypothetical protein